MKSIHRVFLSEDYITIAFVIGLMLLFLMKLYKPNQLLGYTTAFFSKRFIEKNIDDNLSKLNPFYFLLQLFCVLTVAVSFYIFLTPIFYKKDLITVLILFASILIYFSVKVSSLLLVTSLLDLKEKLNYLLNSKNSYFYTVCLLLFPFLVFYQYVFQSKTFLLTVVVFLLVFRFLLILLNNKKIVFRYLFYFILYFCVFEIAPLMLLYKTLN